MSDLVISITLELCREASRLARYQGRTYRGTINTRPVFKPGRAQMTSAEMIKEDEQNRDTLENREFDTNFMVSAGAGAGKSHTIVSRMIHLLCDSNRDIAPENIVAITFTDKATAELKQKITNMLRQEISAETDADRLKRLQIMWEKLPDMQISTIHAFCKRILEEYPIESGVGFAPVWETADSPMNMSSRFFENNWNNGHMTISRQLRLKKDDGKILFGQLLSCSYALIQYLHPDTDYFHQELESIRSYGFDLIRMFGKCDPTAYNYHLTPALRGKSHASDTELLLFVRHFCNYAEKALGWKGKSSRKTADGALKDLKTLIRVNDDMLNAMESCLNAGKGKKAEARDAAIMDSLTVLPESLQRLISVLEAIPEIEKCAVWATRAEALIHGLIMHEMIDIKEKYQKMQMEEHVVSFDDMLRLSVKMIKDYPEIRKKLHQQYRVFFVDEYQDTDPRQTDLIFSLAAEQYADDWHQCVPAPGSLFFVGDPKQAIYRFRNADISLWSEAAATMRRQQGKVLKLYKNFRSTSQICEAATYAFGHGAALEMVKSEYQAQYTPMQSNKGSEINSGVYEHIIEGDKKEDATLTAAATVADLIANMVRYGYHYGDFLLLSRNREKESAYAEEMRKRGIPLRFDGAMKASDWECLKRMDTRIQAVAYPLNDVLAYAVLRQCFFITENEWLSFQEAVKALNRTLPDDKQFFISIRSMAVQIKNIAKHIDKATHHRVIKALNCLHEDTRNAESMSPVSFIEKMLTDPDTLFGGHHYSPEESQNEYAAALKLTEEIRASAPNNLQEAAVQFHFLLSGDMDRMPDIRTDTNVVRLMNVHKSKGLEGNIVFLLPDRAFMRPPSRHLKRENGVELLWLPAGNYKPINFQEAQEREKLFLTAEDDRLRYVALTRAAKQVHVFTFQLSTKTRSPWDGIAIEAKNWGNIEPVSSAPNHQNSADMAKVDLKNTLAKINQSTFTRITPSMLEKPTAALLNQHSPESKVPGGRHWGNMCHEAARTLVKEQTTLEQAAGLAVWKEYHAFDMANEDADLYIPGHLISSDERMDWLRDQLSHSLRFLIDPESPIAVLIKNARTVLTEAPFASAYTSDMPQIKNNFLSTCFDGNNRLEMTGTIDLCLENEDGSWTIIDYKTDRVNGMDEKTYIDRLRELYSEQLKGYGFIVEQLVPQGDISLYICAIPLGGKLIPIQTP